MLLATVVVFCSSGNFHRRRTSLTASRRAPTLPWADANGVGYLAWTWDTWGCSGGQALVSDYSGRPCSPYGASYEQHLASLAGSAAGVAP
jgi:hypothetical protein